MGVDGAEIRDSRERPAPSVPWSSLEWTPACHAGDREFKSRRGRHLVQAGQRSSVGQSVRLITGMSPVQVRALLPSTLGRGEPTRPGGELGRLRLLAPAPQVSSAAVIIQYDPTILLIYNDEAAQRSCRTLSLAW